MTAVDRLRIMRLGRVAYRSGRPSTACPYSLTGTGEEPRQAAVWLRGYVLAQHATD